MKQDLSKYKDRFKSYLNSKGLDVKNPMFCINPAHENTNDPAMIVKDNGFVCQGCGVKGDVYDAAGLICGITELTEQFKEVERTFGDVSFEPIKKKPAFKADPEATKKLESFILKHGGREKGVAAFLTERGYSKDIIPTMTKRFGYWPGRQEAEKTISSKVLDAAGVPEKSWYKSGVVAKLGSGYKLFWYGNDKDGKYGCIKRNSLSARVFPTPATNKELTGSIIITEAELSAISMLASGFENVKASGSVNGITKKNAHLLLNCEEIILAFDGDNAGRYNSGLDEHFINKKTGEKTTPERVVDKILKAGFKGKLFAAKLPDNFDPDDIIRAGEITKLKGFINKAKEIIIKPPEEAKKPKPKKLNPFQFLGYDEKSYFVLPRNQQIPLRISRGDTSIKNWLFELASEDWWFEKFNCETETKEGELKTVFDRKLAFKWFREESYRAGIFDDKRIKGVGAHLDGEKIILNTGKNIKICGNGFIEYEDWTGENFYVKSKRRMDIKGKEWTTEQGAYLWKQIKTFNFERKMDRIAIAGYMVFAPFASILWRRPSIWITAQKGIGKSYLMESLIAPAAGGEEYAIFTEGISSEAYIRQKTKRDHVPVIIDEFEAKNNQETGNLVKILNLMRSAYGGKLIGRGSANHEAIDFSSKTMFCFGSINIRLNNDGDRTRMHICRMTASRGVCKAPTDFEGLRARTFNKLPKIIEDLKSCREALLESGLNDRQADTYSPLLVGCWNLTSDKPFMQEEGRIYDYFIKALAEIKGDDSVDDEHRVVERILQQRIRITADREMTVAEMLVLKADGTLRLEHDERLQRYGLKRTTRKIDNETVEVLAISLNSSDLSKILEDTPFSDYKEIIQRNPFVVEKSYPIRMAGNQLRSVLLKWEDIESHYLGMDEEKEPVKSDLPF